MVPMELGTSVVDERYIDLDSYNNSFDAMVFFHTLISLASIEILVLSKNLLKSSRKLCNLWFS